MAEEMKYLYVATYCKYDPDAQPRELIYSYAVYLLYETDAFSAEKHAKKVCPPGYYLITGQATHIGKPEDIEKNRDGYIELFFA